MLSTRLKLYDWRIGNKHFCKLTTQNGWKLNKKNVFQDALNNQKQQWELGNKDQKIKKTIFKKVSINNFKETRKVDGHKNVVLSSKQKVTKNKIWHEDWDQSPYPDESEQPRFQTRNLVCLNKKRWRLQ